MIKCENVYHWAGNTVRTPQTSVALGSGVKRGVLGKACVAGTPGGEMTRSKWGYTPRALAANWL